MDIDNLPRDKDEDADKLKDSTPILAKDLTNRNRENKKWVVFTPNVLVT